MKQALEGLCACNAPSGFEGPAAQVAQALLEPLMDQVWTDRMGSVIGLRRCGKPGAKKLLLDAHLDEIGLIVTGIEDGFLRFQSIGGVDPRMLPGRELAVLAQQPVLGVVACTPPHLLKDSERKKSVPIDKLFVDVGLSQEEAEKRIPIGTPMVFRGGCAPLGQGKLWGKAMDDRACFVTLVRAAELLKDVKLDVDLYILGSTREEISGAGAKGATFSIAPDFCVAVDVTHGQTPDAPKEKCLTVGGGPAIGVGPNMTRWMTQRMVKKAEKEEIPYQLEVMAGHTGTNGWHMQISREGVATSVVSLPLKYMHSPIEVLDREDMERVAQLLAAFAKRLGEEAGSLC
ncbi:M42 family peptidase [Pseudoflavonifractor sp. 524-17]|uniref:M20/M25/M40 family metallo-hydrolase n=1 Tax=Pseudoflavonifractor sp. 524-17 TaxID=2304577 RepID=UPI00137A8130|nr:M20/M25/M40 family metallo-hydrolase [Pseudoflavonifractor sp. 524-17]NCE65224.1 M42 family peptidase [Pseudoflavonifractor sp. 524-17]